MENNKLQQLTEQVGDWMDEKIIRLKSSARTGGIVLIIATVAALVLSNMSWSSEWYQSFWGISFVMTVGSYVTEFSLIEIVNEGLMSIFFFSVGLEIKREFKYGHLSTWKQASLPVFAALGGMLFPALIYALCNITSPETAHGWGIPMATDIAFSLGILSMFSRKVPLSLKVFLTTLAVADDLGSIIVIALFYSGGVNMTLIGIAFLITLFMFFLNYLRVHTIKFYVIPSIVIWLLFMFSGVHVTIAGVLIAFATPIEGKYSKRYFVAESKRLMQVFVRHEEDDNKMLPEDLHIALQDIRYKARNTISPLFRLEDSLKDVVTYIIMPLFAFANAGVVVSMEAVPDFLSFESVGIVLGLVIGKPLGICLISYLLIKLGMAEKPEGASWIGYIGVGCLGGIGFTMSIFVDTLAFAGLPDFVAVGKIAILIGSLVSAVAGAIILAHIKDIEEKYHW